MSSKAGKTAVSIAAVAAVAGAAALAFSAGDFHALPGITKPEKEAGDVRQFTGDGTAYLHVPGLVTVLGVRVGEQEIPLSIEQEFPIDSTGKRTETVETPLIALVDSPSGEKILLRGMQSNHGIWQDGAPIYVKGEWEDEPEAEAPADDENKGE